MLRPLVLKHIFFGAKAWQGHDRPYEYNEQARNAICEVTSAVECNL